MTDDPYDRYCEDLNLGVELSHCDQVAHDRHRAAVKAIGAPSLRERLAALS